MSKELGKIFENIDDNTENWIENLSEAVSIKSVSATPELRPEVDRMVSWVGDRLEKLGAKVEYCNLGYQTLPNGSELKLPPVIFAEIGHDPKKKSLLVYGHLDVQPASTEDGWNTDPFQLTRSEDGSRLIGRGTTDDKGPVLGWLHAVEAYQQAGVELPINLKFCFEGMEESGSVGLYQLLHERRQSRFLRRVDFVCISDNYWLGKEKPCLTYGLRGNCYFFIEVKCADKDLHSGVFGGSVHEAMPDLIYMLNTLLDKDDKILIEGLQDSVAPLTEDEMSLYQNISFDLDEYKNDIAAKKLIHDDNKIKTLMARWRFNSLSIHGIQGAFSDNGAKTVIPQKVIGKFSVRIVPNQTPELVEKIVIDYLHKKWTERGSSNEMKAYMFHGSRCWVSDTNNENFLAGKRATQIVWGVEPDLTREGCSIPITLTLEEVCGKSVLLLPIGASDDGAHSQNEKIELKNFIQGTKVLAAYIYELGKN